MREEILVALVQREKIAYRTFRCKIRSKVHVFRVVCSNHLGTNQGTTYHFCITKKRAKWSFPEMNHQLGSAGRFVKKIFPEFWFFLFNFKWDSNMLFSMFLKNRSSRPSHKKVTLLYRPIATPSVFFNGINVFLLDQYCA